jgi:tripartite-type tricarboxylate transporter receptor subunit TctC
VRFIVPFGREGASDRAARAFAAGCGLSCEFENLPGKGGRTGVERANDLARAGVPTLLLGTPSTHVLLPSLGGPAPLDEFAPILGLGRAPNVLLAAPSLNVDSVEGLLLAARTRRLTYASAGSGQTIHLCTVLFCAQAQVEMTHRPYAAGSAAAYADVAAGKIDVYFDSLLGCREHIEARKVIPLAISSTARSPSLPTVPTLREWGFEHALDVWLGVFGAHATGLGWHAGPSLAQALGTLGLAQGPVPAGDLRAQVAASLPGWRTAVRLYQSQGGA